MNNSALSEVTHAPSRSARVYAAWKAATELVASPTIGNEPAPYLACRLIAAHGKHGPLETRLSTLEVWRIVVDALHALESRSGHAN